MCSAVSSPARTVGLTSSDTFPTWESVETAMDSRAAAHGLVSERAFACRADTFGDDKAVSLVTALPTGASLDAGAVPFATVSEEVVLACRADISGIDDVASSAVALTEPAFGLTAIT